MQGKESKRQSYSQCKLGRIELDKKSKG